MKALWQKYKPVALYLVFGVVTTLADLGVYRLCFEVLRLPNVPSTVLAWVLAVAVAFVTNKLWVFDSKTAGSKALLSQIRKFVGCRLATGLLNLLIMWVGVDLLQGPPNLLKLASNVVVILLNYLFSKRFVFSKKQ